MQRPKLNIVGCTVVDVLFNRVPRLPRWPDHVEFARENLVLLSQPPIITIGGNGANAAFVASSLGAEVKLYSSIGDDELGRMARRWLKSAGCKVYSPERRLATACNVTAADERHRRATFFYPGTQAKFPRLTVQKGEAVLVCGWPHPPLRVLAREFKRMRRAGALTALDLGPILGPIWPWAELTRVLQHTEVLLGNRHEVLALTGQRTLRRALAQLREVCPGEIVVKLGREGATWSSPSTSSINRIAARHVRAITTVGAGDSFNGALLAAVLHGQPIAKAIKAAVDFATHIVTCRDGVLGAASALRPITRLVR